MASLGRIATARPARDCASDPNQTSSPDRQGVNTNALFGRITTGKSAAEVAVRPADDVVIIASLGGITTARPSRDCAFSGSSGSFSL
jgi:hypothetical protein